MTSTKDQPPEYIIESQSKLHQIVNSASRRLISSVFVKETFTVAGKPKRAERPTARARERRATQARDGSNGTRDTKPTRHMDRSKVTRDRPCQAIATATTDAAASVVGRHLAFHPGPARVARPVAAAAATGGTGAKRRDLPAR